MTKENVFASLLVAMEMVSLIDKWEESIVETHTNNMNEKKQCNKQTIHTACWLFILS